MATDLMPIALENMLRMPSRIPEFNMTDIQGNILRNQLTRGQIGTEGLRQNILSRKFAQEQQQEPLTQMGTLSQTLRQMSPFINLNNYPMFRERAIQAGMPEQFLPDPSTFSGDPQKFEAFKELMIGKAEESEKYTPVQPGQPIMVTGKGGVRFETAPGEAKKTETKLQHVQEDRGDAYRRGTFNPETGEEKWGPWQKKEVSPATEAQEKRTESRYAATLRQQFNSLQPVKDFRDVYARMKIMDEAFEESKTTKNFVAVDQALITLFNKMTDPQSVVRESEYARTPQDLALWNRLKGKVEKFKAGGAGLTMEDRQALITMAKKFEKVYRNIYKMYQNEYRGYAVSSNIDPNSVVTELEAEGQPEEKKSTREAEETKTIGGKTYIKKNGKWYEK